jgi:hypothetical protein
MDILNPPKSYIEYRCTIRGLADKELEDARSKFYRSFPDTKEEIAQFFSWLYEARHDYSLPVEKIELRENDGKKRGNVQPMMIYDIEYWKEKGQTKQRKIYTPAR